MKIVRILTLMLFSKVCWANSSLWVATDEDIGIPPYGVISQFALNFDERVFQDLQVGDSFTVALSATTTATAKLDSINDLDGRLEYIAALTDTDGALAIVQSGNTIEGTVYLTATGIDISVVSGSGGAQVKNIDNFMCDGIPPLTTEQLLSANSNPKSVMRSASFGTFANGLPQLSSNNEPWVFYLDFDGERLRGTKWNSRYGLNTINLAPMNYDGDANTFNAFEQQMIHDMYLRMVDSFSPYRVNITTDVSIFNSTPVSRRGHIVFTPTVGWFPPDKQNAGGRAFYDTFGTYTPSLVFPHNFSERATGTHIGLAAAHEAGHMVKLKHDGLLSQEYPEYHAGQYRGWGPIMGAPYLSAYTTWSNGDYVGATEFQDDLAMINSYIPYRVDSAGNSRNSAKVINTEEFSVAESIHRYDQDYYRFSAKKGQQLQVHIEANGDIPMLNSELTLYDSSGAALVVSDLKPIAPLPEYADRELDADIRYSIVQDGVYYLRIRGVGYNGGSNYKFSRYGAVGQYSMSIQEVDDDILLLIIPLLNNKNKNN